MQNVVDTVDNIGAVIAGVESINEMMNMLYSDMGKQQSANNSVNENAEELRMRSDEVRSASEEQKTAVNVKSITNINDLIQTSAAGSEEMNANAGKLSSMSENFMPKVSFFKV